MKKIVFINVLAGLMVIIAAVYYLSLSDDLSENLIRLHVIANSNSESDIKVKEETRDFILDNMKGIITDTSDSSDILKELPRLEREANRFLEKSGIGYSARVEAEKTEIPRKEYNGIVLPKGEYRAIRVFLGEGKGENWWCVAYPPLCFTEEVTGGLSEDGKELLKGIIAPESYRLITSEIKYELKLVEVARKVINEIKSSIKK